MISNPQKNRLANFLYGKDESQNSTLSPDVFYIGLSTSALTESGVVLGEVSGNGYARVAIPNNKTSFSVADSNTVGRVFNKISVTWPEATASWGTIRTVFFAPTASSNEALYYVSVNKEVPAFSTLYFNGNTNTGDPSLSVSN